MNAAAIVASTVTATVVMSTVVRASPFTETPAATESVSAAGEASSAAVTFRQRSDRAAEGEERPDSHRR